tara:strand:- start:41 stop:280 length:240 start_codon:yes stop_codon:yes gene_type:complete
MGALFRTPKPPKESQASIDARNAEKARLAKEQADLDALKADRDRKRKANLFGMGSLQDDSLGGYTGFKRRKMGSSITGV